jgi:hypothetical protein
LVIENGVPSIFPADHAPILTNETVAEMIADGRIHR